MAHKSHITLFTYNYYLLCEYFITIARLLCSFVRMLCSNTSPKFLKNVRSFLVKMYIN